MLWFMLWIIPYLILLHLIGHLAYWHLVPILTPLCIGAAKLIVALISTINRYTQARMKPPLFPIIISIIGSFGLIRSSTPILSNVTAGYFQIVAFLANHLPNNNLTHNDNTVTLVGARWLLGFS